MRKIHHPFVLHRSFIIPYNMWVLLGTRHHSKNGGSIIRPEMGGQVHLISNKASSSQVQGRLPGPGSGPRWASNWLFGQRGDQQPCPHPQVHRHPMTPFSQLPNKSLGHRGQQQGWKWWTRPCTKAGWRAPRPLKHWSMLRPGDTGGDAHT